MHPWLRGKHRSQQKTAAQPSVDHRQPKPSTAAYHPPEKQAPSHIAENKQRRRDVKQLLTNHWDLDSLTRDELEQAFSRPSHLNSKRPNKET